MNLPVSANKSAPSISILLCNYNHAKYLEESLGAILSQTVPADEIVIVDDGSTDDSVAVIQSLIAGHANVRFLPQAKNQGLMAAIKIALQAASSDFIVWAASDDRLFNNFIARYKEALAQYPQAKLAFSRLATFRTGIAGIMEYTGGPETGPAFDLGPETSFHSPQALINRLQRSYLWMSGNTVVVRKDAIEACGGFRPDLQWHSEWFAFYAIALRHGACVIPETLAAMRGEPTTFSQTGMKDNSRQMAVLGSLATVLCLPENRDIFNAFLRRPSLFSVFGVDMLKVLIKRPSCFPLACRYGQWLCRHWGGIYTSRGAAAGAFLSRTRVAGYSLNLAAQVLQVVLPRSWQ